jgi:hypothetical protein
MAFSLLLLQLLLLLQVELVAVLPLRKKLTSMLY